MPKRTMLALLGVGATLAAPVAVSAAPYQHKPNATAQGTGGAAATVDSVATRAARGVLARGGNAVDAAVAAAAVLGVTEPYSAGIGGGGFMVIRRPNGKVVTIDSREKAPAAMRPDSFIENGTPLPMSDARYSGLSAGVPGTVAGWAKALNRYGTWRFKRVLAPAIDVARQGFVVDDTFVSQTTPNIPYFDDIPATARIYLDPDGTAKDVGAVVRNPDLARTMERIARHGKRGFYRGAIAAALARAAQRPATAPTADKTWRPGLITRQDVQNYRAVIRKPTRVGYRGLDVYSMGPPSSGGTTVGEALNILEQIPGYPGLSEIDKLHYFLEASRFAFADRNVFVADPAYFDVPLRGLLSDEFAKTRAALIGPTDPGAAVAAGDPNAFQGTTKTAASPSTPAQSTTHLTVADRRGSVVSYTFTIESTGGNGIVVPGWGFLLNNELTDFNFDDTDHPNAPEGGKRPRSSISPTYVARNGRPFLAVGTPGGATIITTVLQILTERIDFGRTLPQAIADPRASQRNPTTAGSPTAPEQAFVDRYGAALRAKGHQFSTAAEIGAATGIEFLPRGEMLAAAEPVRRGGGSALVVRQR